MAVTPTILNASPANGLISLSGGNLTATFTNVSAFLDRKSVYSAITGKFYFEVSFPARAGAVEGGVKPFIFETGASKTEATYTRANYALAGTIGVYFDLDANTMGCISPEGTDSGPYATTVYDEGAPVFAGAAVYYDADPGSPGAQVITFNFGATAFYHSVPSGYNAGFGEPEPLGSNLVCPAPILFAGDPPRVANATLTAPHPTLSSASGALASFTAPSPLLISVGHDSTGEQAANLTAPRPTLTVTTGANSRNTGPKQTLVTSGTVTGLASAALFAPEPTLGASGTVTMLGSAALSAPIQRLVGYSGAVCSVSITGAATLTATGTTGAVGGAQLTAPLFELTATATAQNRGSALLTAPSPALGGQARGFLIAPGATLTAIGTAVVTASYEAYALNLNHTPRGGEQPVDELTHFTNYPFTHVVRYQNSYFGANSTGLYLLEGTTDDGVPIPWEVQTAMTDFNTEQKKTVEMAYFGGRFGPASTVKLYVGEVGPTAYSYATPRDTSAQNYRQAFGRGLKSRYYALGAEGTGELTIDSITLNVAVTARKV